MAIKLAVVVSLQQNQPAYVESMRKQLASLDCDIYWVIDRPVSDAIEKELTDAGATNVVVNTFGVGYLSGRLRDLALDNILDKDYDAVLFLDAAYQLLKPVATDSIVRSLAEVDAAMLYFEADTRPVAPLKSIDDFSPSMFLGCGFLVNIDCLKTIRQFSFMNKRCFHESFDGNYGYEDCYFGKLLNDLGYRIGWSDIMLKDAFLLDDFRKIASLGRQLPVYDQLYREIQIKAI